MAFLGQLQKDIPEQDGFSRSRQDKVATSKNHRSEEKH